MTYRDDNTGKPRYDYQRPDQPTTGTAELYAANERARKAAFPPMSDQEIRARALECASRLPATLGGMKPSNAMETMFWETVHDFEAYIRDGVT